MSQPNLTVVAGKSKKKKNYFWVQQSYKPPPLTGYHTTVRSLTEVRTGDPQPVLLPTPPTLIDLVDGKSPHIPSTNTANKNPVTTAQNTSTTTAANLTAKVGMDNFAEDTTNIDNDAESNTSLQINEPTLEQIQMASNQMMWPKFKGKGKGKGKKKKIYKPNICWKKPEADVSENKPEDSDAKQNKDEDQDGPPSVTDPSPTTTSEAKTFTGYKIPKLEPSKRAKKITLTTKQSLQQEMVKQRLNWIKADPNNALNIPGTSDAPQVMVASQTIPSSIPPQAVIPAPLIVAPVPNPVPILENQPAQVRARSNAGSFFKTTVTQSIPVPTHRLTAAFGYKYPKGIPKSFLLKPQDNNQQVTADSPIWPSQNMLYQANTPTLVQPPQVNTTENINQDTSPIFVQTDNQVDVQQPYSPSDVYSELGMNPEPAEDLESPEQNQASQSQKRLSAFQRLGPLSQPKKPKLTINLSLNKEQPVREVVGDTDDDPDRYTPVHLRQDIISSTDDTVVQYLPSWPWRKNVVIRKSVTARNSWSAMILEQEQMEEAYERNNIFIQITVKGYPSTWTKERVLDAVLDNVKGYNLIPCFIEFQQNECKFLTLRCRSALTALHKTGFYIHKDGVELALTISVTDLTLNQIDFIPRIVLRKRLAMCYSDKKLNLSGFTLQNDLSHFVYFPLNNWTNQSAFIQLQSVIEWGHLTEMDLSGNRLTTITGFDLNLTTPRLKHLNLAHNYLEKINVLAGCRNMPLNSIRLEGNPLCHDYIDGEHYIKVIRMIFPAIAEIDGVSIHRKNELPQYKQNFCPEEALEVAEKFLEIYFPLLDSSSDQRSLIQGMYEDDATLTVTYCYKLRYGPIYRCFRNLFLYARFLDEGETDSVVGAMAITKLINRWPQTEHDPHTFTVDVLYHTESTTIIRISGILKLTAETLSEDEHLLSFTRTVVLYSEEGDEYKIHNEMVYWEEPSASAARAAFRVSTKKLNPKIESTTDEDLRAQLLNIFIKLTTMDKKICERCLELNSWNFKLALEHFTKLLKLNNLDSLTQEAQCPA